MKQQTRVEKMTAVNTARAIRAELKKAFPETKFSVTKTPCCNVKVSYDNGVLPSQVRAITSKYQLGKFDSQTDSYDFCSKRNDIPQVELVLVCRYVTGE